VKAGSLMVSLAFIDHRGCNRRGVALTRALHETGKLEDLMTLENRLKGRFLKPFKDELWKTEGPSSVGGIVGRTLQVNIFEGRSFP